MWVGSRHGGHYDATFTIQSAAPVVIFFEAAGGAKERARNTEYHKGLIELLRRLGELGATINDIRVDTAVTRELSPDQRRIHLRSHSLPLSLAGWPGSAFGALKSEISTAARRPGRRPGTASGGSSRNLQIELGALGIDVDTLAAYLAAPRSD